MKPHLLLALNAGSSSIKLGLFDVIDQRPEQIGHGHLDLQREALQLRLAVRGHEAVVPLHAPVTESLHEVVDAVLQALQAHEALGELRAACHRVVHGGTRFHQAVRIDQAVLAQLDALTPLAPLHQPHSLRLIRALQSLRPRLPQTASFDTAFHATQEPLLRRFAVPRRWHDEGIQRYGFHGLSYAFIARELARLRPDLAQGRVVAAHLGNGASLCAMKQGRSVDSSMGFSTLDGVPMGTRCGALDAGVLLHWMGVRGLSLQDVQDMLYHRSGLLGMSGISADVRELEASTSPQADEALRIFAWRCAGEAARLATSLSGLDALVFTAGVGEHDARMRRAICAHLDWLGVSLDDAANARHAPCIGASHSRVAVFVIPTNEEQVMADEAMAVSG